MGLKETFRKFEGGRPLMGQNKVEKNVGGINIIFVQDNHSMSTKGQHLLKGIF